MLQQHSVKINGPTCRPTGHCRAPFLPISHLKYRHATFDCFATATAGSCARASTSQQQDSSKSAVQLSVAAAAAAAAVLLWPAQAAYALPEAQLAQIKQTIDTDFQQGQVGSN